MVVFQFLSNSREYCRQIWLLRIISQADLNSLNYLNSMGRVGTSCFIKTSLTSGDVTTFSSAYFSVIFSMFCIEQAKIYREPKFGSDRAFGGWTRGKLKCRNICLINTGPPCWCTTFFLRFLTETDNSDLLNMLNDQLYMFYKLDFRILMTSNENDL